MQSNSHISPNHHHRLSTLPRFIPHPLSFILLLLLLRPSSFILSQPIDTIIANPKAVELRRVWTIIGKAGDEVGAGVGSVGDINNDGIEDFGVYLANKGYYIYLGDTGTISTTPTLVINGYGGRTPIVGKFWGGKYQAIALQKAYTLNFFRVDSTGLDTIVDAVLDPGKMTLYMRINVDNGVAADLDGDGYDELILYSPGAIRGTVVLRDTEMNRGSGYSGMFIGDIDGDHALDIVTNQDYKGQPNLYRKLKIRYGSLSNPWSWGLPDREIIITALPGDLPNEDYDGDGVLDLVMQSDGLIEPIPNRVRLYLSGSGKNQRTRSYTVEDADKVFYVNPDGGLETFGYLSDSLHRYAMLGVNSPIGLTPRALGLSGGPKGPDRQYDAYRFNDRFINETPIRDATGDGWDDFLGGDPNSNYASLFAGGPYIPRDFDYADVKADSTTYYNTGIYIYPQPANDELNIVLHGTTPEHIARFCVMDVLGRCVAEGTADGRRRYQWCMGQVPSGRYQLVLSDRWGKVVHSKAVVVQP